MKLPKITPVPNRPGLFTVKVTVPSTKRRQSVYGNSIEEVEEKARKLLTAKADASDIRTLAGFYLRVFVPTILDKAPSTIRGYGTTMDKIFLPKFGHRLMAEITRAEWQDAFNRLSHEISSKHTHRGRIMAVLKLAKEDELIKDVPKIRLPQPTAIEKEYPSYEDMAKLIEAASGDMKPVVMLCAIGLRVSEALGATSAQITNGNLRITQQLDPVSRERKPELKTPSSRRVIPLPKDFEAELPTHQLQLTGTITHSAVTDRIKTTCKHAGTKIYTAHQLRHAFTSIMENELEAPRRVCQMLIGHARKGTTDTYSHTELSQLRRWMERYWANIQSCRAGKDGKRTNQTA